MAALLFTRQVARQFPLPLSTLSLFFLFLLPALHGRLLTVQLLHQRATYCADSADSCGVTPLMDASRGNHIDVTQYLLETCGASLEASDVLGRHALHHASQAGAVEAIQYLLQQGVAVNQPVSINAITPLHYAAKV